MILVVVMEEVMEGATEVVVVAAEVVVDKQRNVQEYCIHGC